MSKELKTPDVKSASLRDSERQEIENIKADVNSIKSNVVGLAHDLAESGLKQVDELEEKAKVAYTKMRAQGERKFHDLEKLVQEKPGQSLAIAFVGGIIASYLLGRRSRRD